MKFFKLTKIRRFVILAITIISAILTVALGGVLSVSKNVKKGIAYGGGAEYLIEVDPTAGSGQNAQALAVSVAESIKDRIDALGVGGATAEPENTANNGADVRVTYPALKSDEEKAAMGKLIVDKPILTLTDIYGNVLFDENGHFNQLLNKDVKSFVGTPSHNGESIENFKGEWTEVPIAQGGAQATTTQTGEHQVSLTLINGSEYSTAWTQATSYIASLGKANKIVTWLNYEDFINEAKDDYPSDWSASGKNPYMYAHVGNVIADSAGKATALKYFTTNSGQFLISTAGVSKALSGKSFVLSGNFQQAETEKLAKQINYGVARYTLKTLSSINVDASYGSSAFNKAMIAGMVVFAMVAIFLIANYGLLGALSTISLGLYIYLVLQLFTVMRGEYSPETIAALIIGIGMGVDANIITYERLKAEVYNDVSVKKAFKKSNKQSLTTIFDANITTLIVAFVLFYFGTKSIVGLSVTLILSITFTLIIMLGFTRFMATMLVNSGMFEEKKHLLGIKPKFDVKVQEKINKFDYIKNSKWFVMCSALVMGAGLIVMSVFAGLGGSIKKGFIASQDFTGGTVISLTAKDDIAGNSAIDDFTKELEDTYNVPKADIAITTSTDGADNVKVLNVKTTTIMDPQVIQDELKNNKAFDSFIDNKTNIANTTTTVANKLVKDAMYAILIAMALIVIYTLIRFKWTFSFAAIVALVHDGLIVTAVFIIARVEISPVFIAGLLSILGYSINDTIVTFDRIREKLNNSTGELDPAKIKLIANDAIKDTLKRSLLTSFTTIMAVVVLMCFGNATKLSFNLAMLVGLLAGTYSSIFIASYLWVKLEIFRQKRIKVREANGFWKSKGIEEQTFPEINDFIA